ncbi:efflux RND transporter periplasmic adaptor subunit [Sulfurisoma sediminicola]|uniref:RND family efflux transporter MFP subunit n=1 Tax=Sulfurisoma sediminicola TaxID=1381557 RepID=A0A497XJC8_9PROT|nr:efflux RND transporter periplasmic adaptor subunit [Sulfurisoma sediminicola]RLJ68021.1 RND family efflux transporter MFP subunit [Sulfurisoma sediminicola]
MMNLSAFAVSIAAVLTLAGCGEKSPPPEAQQAGPKLVKALKVGAGDTAQSNRYSGEVRARYESTLGFRTGGKIVERLVDAGAHVRAGQPLARLDPADAQLTATQAEANRALAAADLKRTQDLRAKNFISQAALDTKEAAAKAADAQAGLARNQAGYTMLTADAAGVIAAVLAEPGQVVSAGQGVFRLARDGEREVAIGIPESRIAGLKVGAGATVELWAGKSYKGVLRELAPAADSATRTFAARISIVDADPAIALGMTATATFTDAGADRIVVPLAALIQKGDAASVWVIGKDATVVQRPVEVERFGDGGAVLKSGLNPGELIVAAGAFKLTAGEKVRLAEEARK